MQHCQLAHDKRQCPVNVGSPQTKTQCDQVIRLISYLQSTYKNNLQVLKQEENRRNRNNTKYRRRSEGPVVNAQAAATENNRRRQTRKGSTPIAGRVVAGPPITLVANRRPQRQTEPEKERIVIVPSTDSTEELSSETPQRKASGADTETSIASDSMMNEVDEAVFQMLSSDSEDEKPTPTEPPHTAMPVVASPTLLTVTPSLSTSTSSPTPSYTPPADAKSSTPQVLLPPVTLTPPPDTSSPNTPTSMEVEQAALPTVLGAPSSNSLSLSPSPPLTKAPHEPSPRDVASRTSEKTPDDKAEIEPRVSDVGPLVSRSPEPKPPPRLKLASRSWKGGLKSLRNVLTGSGASGSSEPAPPERNMFRRWSFSNPLRRHHKDEKFETVIPS